MSALEELIARESAELHASLDRKEAELDRYGYGRPPPRPPREVYVRVSVQANGWTMEPALEWRSGRDSYQRIVDDLTSIARAVAERDVRLAPPECAEAVGQEIAAAFPDRAFFVETWDDVLPGFGQCYQPYGVPRDR